MIYFGKEKNKKFRFGIKFKKQLMPILSFRLYWHYFLMVYLGDYKYYVCLNPVKRIKKDRLYKIGEFEIYRTSKREKYKFRKEKGWRE